MGTRRADLHPLIFNNYFFYLKSMKKLLSFVLLLTFCIPCLALEYNIQSEDEAFLMGEDETYVVETYYAHLFKKEEFESKMKKILKMIKSDKKPIFKISLKDTDQDVFIERYCKKHFKDAYINENQELVIYKEKTVQVSDN